MSQKKKKVLKVVVIIIVILTLIWMLGIRLIIWLFAQDAFYVGSAAGYFTKYDITLEDTQTISHNGITMNIPSDYVEDEPLGNTIIYRSPDETAAVMILAADTDSNMALFSEKTIAEMSDSFLGKIGTHQLMNGFKAMGNGFPDTWYTTFKSLCLLSADDYSFLNWKQGFAYVVSKMMADALLIRDDYKYLYETEDICCILQISDNMNGTGAYRAYAYMFSTDDLNTNHTVLFRANSLDELYGMINSIVIE